MILQDRDVDIINYLEQNGGTIQQIGELYFNGSYAAAKHRLRKLEQDKFLKGAIHPIINKKVYYKGKIPSYHKIIAQDIYIKNKELIKEFRREVKLDKHIVDIFILTKKLNIYVIELDIFNKTTSKKIDTVKMYIKTKLGKEARVIVLSKKDIEKEILQLVG
jgi:DNA-binding Lrp family transcriptional regulator